MVWREEVGAVKEWRETERQKQHCIKKRRKMETQRD